VSSRSLLPGFTFFKLTSHSVHLPRYFDKLKDKQEWVRQLKADFTQRKKESNPNPGRRKLCKADVKTPSSPLPPPLDSLETLSIDDGEIVCEEDDSLETLSIDDGEIVSEEDFDDWLDALGGEFNEEVVF